MRMFFIAVVAVLTLAVTAQAGNPSLCAKDGWQTAQASNGATFLSHKECVKAKDVYSPSVTLDPASLPGGYGSVNVQAQGFNESTAVTLALNFPGQAPHYFVFGETTDAVGAVFIPTFFLDCGDAPTITFTVTDSAGVHASAELALC